MDDTTLDDRLLILFVRRYIDHHGGMILTTGVTLTTDMILRAWQRYQARMQLAWVRNHYVHLTNDDGSGIWVNMRTPEPSGFAQSNV